MMELTKRQNDTLDVIKKFVVENNCSPTVREIAKNLNLSSPATIQTHIKELEKKGYIKKRNNKNRTIELLVYNEYDKRNLIEVPLLNDLNNIKNINNSKEYISIPNYLAHQNNNIFGLIINSSIDNDIFLINDIVIFKKTNTAFDNDIVIINDNEFKITRYNKNSSPNIIGKAILMYRNL